MKKLYTLALTAISVVAFAQNEPQIISFEPSEGFWPYLTINGYGGWEVTEGNDGFIENQIISGDVHSQGSFSFKNAYEADYGQMPYVIMGATKLFAQPMAPNFTLTYDVYITEDATSLFEFLLFNEEGLCAGGIDLLDGETYVYINNDFEGEMIDTDLFTWEPETWIQFKIVVNGNEVKYYAGTTLLYTSTDFESSNVIGMNMAHDNWGGDAYYDNIVITPNSTAGTGDFNMAEVAIYPNPAKDVLSVQLPAGVVAESVQILNLNGQKVLEGKGATINVSSLSEGMYFAKVSTAEGTSLTKKFVKK